MASNIAVIGCGAIAQLFYLPALAKMRAEFDRVCLVDCSQEVLAAAAGILPGAHFQTLSDIDAVDYAIVAAPNALHFDLAKDALLRGAHVLLEKPFVLSPEQGRELMRCAETARRILAINQTRRFFPNIRHIKRSLQGGEYGTLLAIRHHEGAKLSWPYASGAAFAPDARRTGVIMDFGVHVLDIYQYLLDPSWSFVDAAHDGFKGPEGLADISVLANGVPIDIKLSRYFEQENIARLTFERADVWFDVNDHNVHFVRPVNGATTRVRSPHPVSSYEDLASSVIANFLAASQGRAVPECDGYSSLPVIEMLDTIYSSGHLYPSQVGAT